MDAVGFFGEAESDAVQVGANSGFILSLIINQSINHCTAKKPVLVPTFYL